MNTTTVGVQLIGEIWQPGVGPCAMSYGSIVVEHGGDFPNRDDVENALVNQTGDFRAEWYEPQGNCECCGRAKREHHEIPWLDEDSELTYNDCMYPSED